MTPRKIDRVEIRKDEGQLVEIAIPLITKRAKCFSPRRSKSRPVVFPAMPEESDECEQSAGN